MTSAAERLWTLVQNRSGLDQLPRHLEPRYGIRVRSLTRLDAGVLRVEREGGPDWVARVFPAARPIEAVQGDAAALRFLAEHGIPAERCADPEPVSTLEGQGVLVTEWLPGRAPANDERTQRAFADIVGRVQTLPKGPGELGREAGSLHYASPAGGGPRADIAATHAWLADAEARVPAEHLSLYAAIRERLARMDDLLDLPRALIHPDPVPGNLIETPGGDMVPIDWTGAGWGPRITPLGFLLWQAGPRRVTSVVAAYRRHVRPTEGELARLANAARRPALVLSCFHFALGRTTVPQFAEELARIVGRSNKIAAAAREAFAAE